MSSKPPYCHVELWKGKISIKVELINLNTKDTLALAKAKKKLMLQFDQSHEPMVLYHGESYSNV